MGIIRFDAPPVIAADASAAGEHERRGPLGGCFDVCDPKGDDYFGADTWEKAESELQKRALMAAMAKAAARGIAPSAVFAGDLINQCTVSANALGGFGLEFLGLYGACSTAAESLMLAAMWADKCGAAASAVTSSHNCAAERQFRSPVEYGGQRTPTSQWTATAAGAFIVCPPAIYAPHAAPEGEKPSPYAAAITGAMAGRIADGGVSDANNMGAAMAPAAFDTVSRYLEESGGKPEDFDAIVTGDLGFEGRRLFVELCARGGFDVSAVSRDCGLLLYDREAQDKHAGGSGCGCSAAVMSAYFLPKLRSGEMRRLLFAGTGALMSQLSVGQGMSIPSIAHAVEIRGVNCR